MDALDWFAISGVVLWFVALWLISRRGKKSKPLEKPWWEVAEDRLREKREEQEKKER